MNDDFLERWNDIASEKKYKLFFWQILGLVSSKTVFLIFFDRISIFFVNVLVTLETISKSFQVHIAKIDVFNFFG